MKYSKLLAKQCDVDKTKKRARERERSSVVCYSCLAGCYDDDNDDVMFLIRFKYHFNVTFGGQHIAIAWASQPFKFIWQRDDIIK